MGSFADAMLGMLFGWLQALINWIWGVINRGGSALGTWFLQNWLPLTLILIAGGLVVDWFIWLIRWRPYHVWGTRLRRIGRFFRRSSGEEEPGGLAYAEGYGAAEEDPLPDDDPGYGHAYQTEIYAPTSAQAPLLADFPGDTYVDAPMPEDAYYDDPEFSAGEDAPMDGMEAFEAYPNDGGQWEAWQSGEDAPAEEPVWADDVDSASDWGEAPFEYAQDAGDFAYRELIPLDEEEDTDAEPLWPEDGTGLDEAAEMEAEEEMYDDFSNRGAPEPPQKRRRWEFPEEDAPATTRRSRAAEEEDSPPTRRDARPAMDPPAPSRRRRDMGRVEDASEPMMDVDPLAAYDAPEVMEQMEQQRPRRQSRDAGDPVEETGDGAEPRRRRRSTRRRRSEAAQGPAQENEAYGEYPEEYPEEPLPEEMYEAPGEAPRRRGRSGRSGRSRGRTQEAREGNSDFAEEEPYYEEPYYEEDLPRGGYDNSGYDDDAYFHDDPYADDLPDSPEWNDWDEEPELSRGGNRGVTKPSLFDRLRGLSSPTRTPKPEEEDYYDEPYDDAYEDEVEARPKKKGLLSRWLNPEQPEFQQPKPKPRVRQEDAYNEPVYPPKKRR